MSSNSCWPTNQSWKRYWPSGILAVIAVVQLLISFAILLLQIAIVVIGTVFLCNGVTPRYVMGFVCWAFFLACWISIFCVTCCHRSSVVCATYVLVKNILAFIFSAVLIDFDRKFINNPGYDYNPIVYSTTVSCYGLYSSDNSTDFGGISVSITKGQLAGSVIILVSSLLYVAIYIYVYIRALNDDRNVQNTFVAGGQRVPNQYPSYVVPQQQTANVPVQTAVYAAEPSSNYNPKTLHSNVNSQF